MHILAGLKVLVDVLEGGKCYFHNLNISQQKKNSFPFHLSELTFRFWYLDYIKVSHRVETIKYRTSQVMLWVK